LIYRGKRQGNHTQTGQAGLFGVEHKTRETLIYSRNPSSAIRCQLSAPTKKEHKAQALAPSFPAGWVTLPKIPYTSLLAHVLQHGVQAFGGVGGLRIVIGQFQDVGPVDVAIKSNQGIGADCIQVDIQFMASPLPSSLYSNVPRLLRSPNGRGIDARSVQTGAGKRNARPLLTRYFPGYGGTSLEHCSAVAFTTRWPTRLSTKTHISLI
jgi:hypothetical protein